MADLVVASPRLKGIQRTALTMLVVTGSINYFDRVALAIANPLVRHDLGLSVAQMGVLLSVFLWSYAFSQLPVGAMVDRIGPRILLGAGMLLWSVAQAAAGFVDRHGPVRLDAHLPRHRREPAIPARRPRRAQLVQHPRPRHAHRHLQLRLHARPGDRAAAADRADARLRLALDVHPARHRRDCRRDRVGNPLSRPAALRTRRRRAELSERGRRRDRKRRASASPSGAACSASAPPGG